MRILSTAIAIALVSFAFTATGAFAASQTVAANPTLLPFHLPAPAPVADWTHLGCWTPRSGSPCVDIYRDGSGQLWKCKACGKTGNPSPGKCSKTSQAELDRGLWCS
jgi:hypothetical protein